MCFYTRGSRIRIATKDIVCYKNVRINEDYCLSLYQDFKYEYNKTYSGKSKWTLFLKWLFNEDINSEAYHSYKHNIFTTKCIIPKGSLYLISDKSHEYCSSSIKILKP